MLASTGVVFFIKRSNDKLGSRCAFDHTKKFGANQRNGKNSAAVAKTLDPTQAVDKITSSNLFVKTFPRGVSAILVKLTKEMLADSHETRRCCDDAKLHCWIENEIPVRREQANLESVIF